MPYFVFVSTNAVLVRKIDKTEMNIERVPCAKGADAVGG